MESLKTALFEDPFYVYLLLGIAGVIALGVWYGRRSAKPLGALLAVAAAAGGVFLLDRAVVTDREQIWAAYDDIAEAVAQHDIERVASHLDLKYRGWGGLRTAAILAAEAAVKSYNIREVRYVGRREVTVTGNTADSRVTTSIHYGGDASRPSRILRGWKVEWIRREDGWKVRAAEPTDDVLPR
jgi:hypothetical protein